MRFSKRSLDSAALFAILVIALLNLNGVGYMVLGQGQLFTMPLIASCIYLIVRHPARAISGPVLGYSVCIAAYLVVGGLASTFGSASESPLSLLLLYSSSIIMVAGTVCGVGLLVDRGEMLALSKWLWAILVASCALIIISPVIYPYFVHAPPSSEYRSSGAFANPNQAGVVALFGLAVAISPRALSLRPAICLGVLACVAIGLTYSKTAILGALLIVLMSPALHSGPRLRPLIYCGVAALFVALPWISMGAKLPRWMGESLTDQQLARVEQVLAALGGDFGADVTTGRSELWSLGVSRIAESPIIGHGIGTFHALEGGIYTSSGWLGVHNAFLMLAGESGLPVLGLFMLALALVFLISKGEQGQTAKLFFVCVVIGMMATHGALGLRFINVITGIALALAFFRKTSV